MVSHVLLEEANEESGGIDFIVYLKVTENIWKDVWSSYLLVIVTRISKKKTKMKMTVAYALVSFSRSEELESCMKNSKQSSKFKSTFPSIVGNFNVNVMQEGWRKNVLKWDKIKKWSSPLYFFC